VWKFEINVEQYRLIDISDCKQGMGWDGPTSTKSKLMWSSTIINLVSGCKQEWSKPRYAWKINTHAYARVRTYTPPHTHTHTERAIFLLIIF